MNLEDFLSGDDSFIKSLSRQKNELSLAKNWLEETGGEIVEGLYTDEVGYVTSLRELPLYEDIKDDLELYVGLVGKGRLSVSISDEHKINTYVLKHFMTVKHSLEHFLSDPDYASGNGRGKVSFGSALGLSSVLSSYDCTLNDGAGGLKSERGDCRKIYFAIRTGNLAEDELLSSIGLADEWSAYQETRGVTKDYRRLAKKTLTHFLSDPDYASGNGNGKVSFGSALGLSSVLRSYDCTLNDGAGGLKDRRGDCRKIYRAIERGNLTDDELLSSIGLEDEWSAYQETRGVTKDYCRLAKKTLTHFLSDPDYASGRGKVSFGSALGLSSVLHDYDCTLNDGDGGLKNSKGDCYKIYRAIERGNLAENELLSSIGLADEWSAYQRSDIDNPYKSFSEVLS